jgi:membrane protease YdiL (CAAX protease family)
MPAVAPAGPSAGPEPERGRGWEFIALAALGDNRLRCYLIGLLRVLLYPLGFAVAVGLGIGVWNGVTAVLTHKPLQGIPPIGTMVLQLGSIAMVGAAVIRTTVRTHRRPWRSLIAPDLRLDWRRLAIAVGVEAMLLLGQLALAHALTGQPWGSLSAAQLPVIAVVVLLVPLQAASEEIVFRGYLTQALGLVIPSRCLIAVAVAVLFGGLHLNTYGPLSPPYFMLVSLIYSLVSLRDGRLELTIGAHIAMNVSGIVVANAIPGAVGGAPDGAYAAVVLTWVTLPILAVHGGLFYGLTRLLVRLFCEPRRAA